MSFSAWLHLVSAVAWIPITAAIFLLDLESAVWIVLLMSAYANFKTDWGDYHAARAEERNAP